MKVAYMIKNSQTFSLNRTLDTYYICNKLSFLFSIESDLSWNDQFLLCRNLPQESSTSYSDPGIIHPLNFSLSTWPKFA